MYLWLHMRQQCSLKIGAEYFLPDPISSPHLHLRCLLNREFSSNWCLSQCEWFPIIEFSACTYSNGEFQLFKYSKFQVFKIQILGLLDLPQVPRTSLLRLIFFYISLFICLISSFPLRMRRWTVRPSPLDSLQNWAVLLAEPLYLKTSKAQNMFSSCNVKKSKNLGFLVCWDNPFWSTLFFGLFLNLRI